MPKLEKYHSDRPLRRTLIMTQLEEELIKIPANATDNEIKLIELRVRILEKLSDLRLAQYNAQKRRKRQREKNKNMVRSDNALIASKRKNKKPASEIQDAGNFDSLLG